VPGGAGAVARSTPTAPRVAGREPTHAGAPRAVRAAAAVAAPAARAPAATRPGPETAPPAEPPAAEGSELPTYPTRIAGAFRHGYELRRGALIGAAELHWQPSPEGYSLELRGGAGGVEAIGLVSRGGFDPAGLAPERLVDRRRGRDRSAANFDRVNGRITFSGPQVSYGLPPGAQDRLSWMLQLAGIVEADPARFGPGARITLFVAGARGDGEPWAFGVLAREPVELADGSAIEALRLRREPVRPYDTRVEVWLDPARGHLPVRTHVDTVPPTQALELVLRP